MKNLDILVALNPIIEAFEKLGVSYSIGGSVASSAYGLARATLDVDLVSDLQSHHVRPLVELLAAWYYIDEEMILEAINKRTSFNLIHLETMLKIDVFILKIDPYHQKSFERKRKEVLGETAEFYFVSPEDIILTKLEWYRLSGELSERQWSDVLGVLKVQGNSLDTAYLQYWASELQLIDLLNRACTEASIINK